MFQYRSKCLYGYIKYNNLALIRNGVGVQCDHRMNICVYIYSCCLCMKCGVGFEDGVQWTDRAGV